MSNISLAQLHGRVQSFDRGRLGSVRPATARSLVGCLLLRELGDGSPILARIVETEYYGPDDPASHGFGGRTQRCASMFARPGTAYVYRIYGIHRCLNISVGPSGVGAAVLLRAAIVIAGTSAVRGHRGPRPTEDALLRGPGNLAAGLGIGVQDHDGTDVLREDAGLQLLHDDYRPGAGRIRSGPRVGVRRSAETPWRFWLRDVAAVSRYRPAT